MSRIEVREDRCKGCLLCATVCPKEIITQAERFNPHGYKPAEVKPEVQDQCTGCASCALICPDVAITVYKTKKKDKKGAANG